MTLSEPAQYTLAQLAAESGITERTIRYYQAERLLPKPGKAGRDSVYDANHLERLRLIVDLRDRGLTLNTIRELVTQDEPARTVAAWLGVDATLTAPWSQDRVRIVSNDELRAIVGRRPGAVAEFTDAGFATPNPDGTWTLPSPRLLELAIQLREGGIAVDLAGAIRDLLRRRLSSAVNDAVRLLFERAGRGFAGDVSTEELAVAIDTLRPIALEMSSLVLAQEVERALRSLVAEGPGHLAKAKRH